MDEQPPNLVPGVEEVQTPEPRELEFQVPKNFQIGLSSDGQSLIFVLDAKLPTQHAYVLPIDGAVSAAMQMLQIAKAQKTREAAMKPKIILPGLGNPAPSNAQWPMVAGRQVGGRRN